MQMVLCYDNRMKTLTLIGRAEKVKIPQISDKKIPAKIDTGADACSIWAHMTDIEGGNLKVVFFDENSEYYTGEQHVFLPDEFSITRVANSFGHREVRYKVKMKIRLKGRTINGTFTLSDRSTKLYPMLIGRSLLKNKFLVDVAKGSPLLAEEKERAKRLQAELNSEKGSN